jgi:penicillin V acylase-like amidase (Ntn superfamily)
MALALVTVLAPPAAACTEFILKVQGHGIVIEYVQEGLRSYDHAELGVLTNSSPFDWHIINIGNYLNIRAAEVQPVKMGNTACPGRQRQTGKAQDQEYGR